MGTQLNIGTILAGVCGIVGTLCLIFGGISYATNKADPQGGASEQRMMNFFTGAAVAYAIGAFCLTLDFSFSI